MIFENHSRFLPHCSTNQPPKMMAKRVPMTIFLAAMTSFALARTTRVPQTTVSITVNSPIEKAFDYIVPIDLTRIFKRYKNYPAVTHTSVREDWKTAGMNRTVYFEDGTTSRETLTLVERPTSFAYRIYDFTSPNLKRGAKRIEGSWLFTDLGNGQTRIEWTYQVVPKHFVARWILKGLVKKDINALLTNALITIKNDLEK